MIGYFYHDIHHWSWEGCVGWYRFLKE
jgi:hypothetical protein